MSIDLEDEDNEEVESLGDTLIHAYGEYWSREAVDWKSKKISGERRKIRGTSKAKHCEVWNQRGIYALYKDFKLVYVGLAISKTRGIGSRLHDHCTKASKRDRWDSFSWFGIDSYDNAGKLKPDVASKVNEATIIRTLELVAILVADPPMNRSKGKFTGAERISQAVIKTPPADDASINDQLAEITKMLLALRHKG